MAKGILGVVYEKGDTQRAAVSVRSLPTGEKLENKLNKEHADLQLCVKSVFEIECKGEIVKIETKLRELLKRTSGPFKSENGWEFYNISADDLAFAIEALLCICKNISSISKCSVL